MGALFILVIAYSFKKYNNSLSLSFLYNTDHNRILITTENNAKLEKGCFSSTAIIKALLCSQPLVDIIKDTNSNNGYAHIEKGDNTTVLTHTFMFIQMVGRLQHEVLYYPSS